LSMCRRCLPSAGCFGSNAAAPAGGFGRGGGAGRAGRLGSGRSLPVNPLGLGLGVNLSRYCRIANCFLVKLRGDAKARECADQWRWSSHAAIRPG
jgi:hypothetical protein